MCKGFNKHIWYMGDYKRFRNFWPSIRLFNALIFWWFATTHALLFMFCTNIYFSFEVHYKTLFFSDKMCASNKPVTMISCVRNVLNHFTCTQKHSPIHTKTYQYDSSPLKIHTLEKKPKQLLPRGNLWPKLV